MNERLLDRLKNDYPDLKFRAHKKFAFRFPRLICYDETEANFDNLLLHEVGHAILGHMNFETDIKRLKMEIDAWEVSRDLANHYGVEFNEKAMQYELDTYRDWLHKKSRCPSCGLTRFQDTDGYHCPRCENLA